MKTIIERGRWWWLLLSRLVCLIIVTGTALSQTAPKRILVTLISDSSTPICPSATVPHTFGDRLLANGNRTPFTIPPGYIFVITSFDWVVEGSSQAKNTVWTAVTLGGAGKNNALFSGAIADSIGRAAGSTIVPDGIAVASGTVMCLDFVGGATDAFARLHGYLKRTN